MVTRCGRSGWWWPGHRAPSKSRQQVDALECAVWGGRARRSVAGWHADDMVEVTGAIRRRFFKAAGGAASRVEVEVAAGKAHPSRRERMSTPMLGFGWKEVAFSGSSRSPVTARRTRS